MIREFSEEDSSVDSILVDPKDSRVAIVRPLQIKFLGRGKYKDVTNKVFIEFLEEKSNYEQSDISLILVLGGKIKIKLREVVDWLNEHDFPFEEVVLINPNNETGDMEFYQLKPNKNGFSSMKFDRKEMFSE